MFKNKMLFCLLTVAAFPVLADIDFTTWINDVHRQGNHELAGGMRIRVNDNDFSGVSPAEPYYMRLRMDNNAVFANTLVDQTRTDPLISQPIYMAMMIPLDPGSNVVLTAPVDTVSVVRWVAGEDEVWIRVQRPSEDWLEINGAPSAPTTSVPVEWLFGGSARLSHDRHDGIDPSRYNLPFNTRNLATTGNDADAVSMLPCLDLSNSELEFNELLEMDHVLFDHTAQQSPGVYAPGNPVGSSFLPILNIARGRDTPCNFDPTSVFDPGISDGDLVAFDGVLQFSGECGGGSLPPIQIIADGSFIVLEIDPANQAGFEAGYAHFPNQTMGGVEVVDPDSAFVVDGRTLYSRLTLFWNDTAVSLGNVPVAVRVVMSKTPGALPPVMNWNLHLTWRDAGDVDDPPFDGPDQHAFCGPSVINAQSGVLQTAINVPTLGQWALIAFCTLLAASAMWLRRRRAAVC